MEELTESFGRTGKMEGKKAALEGCMGYLRHEWESKGARRSSVAGPSNQGQAGRGWLFVDAVSWRPSATRFPWGLLQPPQIFVPVSGWSEPQGNIRKRGALAEAAPPGRGGAHSNVVIFESAFLRRHHRFGGAVATAPTARARRRQVCRWGLAGRTSRDSESRSRDRLGAAVAVTEASRQRPLGV
ncbi:hypothetical protein BDY21DRAFT_388920 [Lineolata rhizophorae]|uniref:Uncharacterized protein n=1 Tax=Lineolata rhizophorae TaxID=578093 RepID=A0A6A6PDG1_9PEZI|nr:hypothetical protein BDY21DRAFT_388920 [Lineolata rhizophorae]